MTSASAPSQILLVTGMSGAGKSTALDTLEDLGWEVVDNLPLRLLDNLLALPPAGQADRPLAIGIDSRTRGFDAAVTVGRVDALRREAGSPVQLLFLDCTTPELERRFSETRRRHPLAADRPASDGIDAERALLDPLARAADLMVETSDMSAHDLQQDLRRRFADAAASQPVLSIRSFGFKRGLPRNADLVFDMRFLRNPYWNETLRPLTGLDPVVADYIADDPAYAEAIDRITDLLRLLLPRYRVEGKSYVTIAFGCTGGRHRSVHVACRIAARLRDAGFSPTVSHRDLPAKAAAKDEAVTG